MKTAKYKSTGRKGFFDKDETSAKLSKLGNPLEKLHTCTLYEVRSKVIDFEMFRLNLEENMLNQNKKNSAGCKPFDVVTRTSYVVQV